MKKILFLVLILGLVNSCSHNSSNLPDWVLNPYMKNGVAAVGISYPSDNQTLIAENDARAEISKIIGAKITRIINDISGQIKFKNSSQVKKIFNQATQEVIKNLPISKASEVNSYKDKEGVLYVRLFLKNEDYKKSAEAVQAIYQKHVNKSHLKNGDKEKANELVQALFGYSKNHYQIHKVDLY
ncbi:MAG: hypothetical protein KGQ36_03555 [Rickettsiales bacterium]|nr:hypothetical protein [Rickettsiales bacterium]